MKDMNIRQKQRFDHKRNEFVEDLRILTRSSYWEYFDTETKALILTQLGVHHGFYKANG